jgi:hypothetical protein
MIIRLTTKLAAKVKVKTLASLPPDANLLADWTANLFTVGRAQHVIATNTASLYSFLFPGRGLASERQFVTGFLESLQLFLAADELHLDYQQWIEPTAHQIQFSKALDRSVMGSMNELVFHARHWLEGGELSLNEIASRLNDTPFSSLEYGNPRESIQELMLPKSSSQ